MRVRHGELAEGGKGLSVHHHRAHVPMVMTQAMKNKEAVLIEVTPIHDGKVARPGEFPDPVHRVTTPVKGDHALEIRYGQQRLFILDD